MDYSYISNVPGCWNSILDMMSGNVSLIYYSHIITLVTSIIVGFFVIFKGRELINKVLFSFCVTFCIWVIINLISWLNCNSSYVSTAWSLYGILYSLIPILSLYLYYVFINGKDIRPSFKYLLFVPSLPMFFLTLTSKIIIGFNVVDSTVLEDVNITYYYYSIGYLVIFLLIVFFVMGYIRNKDKQQRKTSLLMLIGLESFLILFYSLSFLAEYFGNYGIEFYGLFGMVIFMAFLAYLIVKFKMFNIKLIATQALVWALIILIGSQFLFIQNNVNKVLTAITLVLSAWMGLIIVRSVKKEISQREHIEQLAGELQVANKGQENLIHIMNHQIKGFLGITRNIFAELLQGEDYGVMPDPAKPLLEKGLETTVKGVDYVQAILRGASAEKGTLTYDMKPINVRDIVSELISKQKSIVEKAGLAFESKIGDGLYGIVGDAIHIKEAFKNLITNAIKYNDYTYPDRSVRVDLEREGSNIVFSVRDTGIGIKDEDKPRMFTAGGAGKDSLKYNVESSGFGLSYVKGVADRHGGKVGFKSNAPEKGTTFFIKIPVDAK